MVRVECRLRRMLLTSASLAGSVFALGSGPAWAQTPPAGATPAAGALEEVIVTAQKRSEDLQNVPISIKALTGESLAKSGVTTLDGLQRYAPGLTISAVGSGFVSYTYIRGAGTNQLDAGSDPSVAYFVDEVYVGGTAGLQFDLFDIDRVEVLKGPQGTLFGRNAAAGAISITTKRPAPSFGGTLSLEGGDYGDFSARGGVTGPMSDTLRYRFSAGYRRRDAFTKNLAGGGDPGNIESYGARGQLEWVGENVSFLLSAEGMAGRNGMTNQFLSTNAKTGLLSPAAAAVLPAGESFYAHYYNVVGYENQNLGDITGRLEWKTPVGALTSITAYRSNQFNRVQDQDGTLAAAFVLSSRETDHTFSQEIRLAGDSLDRLHWIGGLYYYHGDTSQHFVVDTGPDFAVAAAQNVQRTDDTHIITNSYAVFGQATWDLTRQISITVGGRYTDDRKHDDRTVKGLGPVFSVSPSAHWSSFDPAATLNFKLTPNILTYFSYRQGFKSGGFQTLLPASAAVAAAPFLPERVTSYELGIKSAWLDHRVTVNAALFRADITNQQILRITGPALQTIDNAGATRTNGLDLSVVARPVPELRLGIDMTIQRAKFVQYDNGAVSYAGNTQLRSPDYMGAYSFEYDLPLREVGMLTLRGEYVYRSKTFFDVANTQSAGLYQPGFGLANARLTYTPPHGDWRLAIWGKNLGDIRYFRNITPSGPTGLAVPGDPRTFGVSFDVNFQ